MIPIPACFTFFFLKEWIISWAIIILSDICLLERNASWKGEMKLFRSGLILLARILAMILYMVLQSPMGLKPLGSLGCLLLGIRKRKVLLNSGWRVPVIKKCWMADMTCFPTVSQFSLKKLAGKPSGPGDLFSLRCLITN